VGTTTAGRRGIIQNTRNLVKKVMANFSYQIILSEIHIVICATFNLGENNNVE